MPDFQLNNTVQNLPPSGIRKFFDLVLEAGPDVISLGVGEPDFPTPWHIRYHAIQGLEDGFTSYTSNKGLYALREAVAGDTKEKWGIDYDSHEEVLITNGVSEGMDLGFRACLNPGDIVLAPDPGYVMYEPLIKLTGADIKFYDPLDLSNLESIAKGAKAIVINYPGNPMGNTFSQEELETIAHIAETENLIVFSDEIYGGLDYQSNHTAFPTLKGMKDRTLWFNGLSKTHSMTGFRIGWVCGPEPLLKLLHKIHQYSALCPGSIAQYAAVEAVKNGDSEAEKMKQEFKIRRKFCVERLKELNLSFHEPQGAFYLFVDISQTRLDEVTFCEKLLEEEKLAVVPGSAFGKKGAGYIRLTYAEHQEKLKQAFERLERFLKK